MVGFLEAKMRSWTVHATRDLIEKVENRIVVNTFGDEFCSKCKHKKRVYKITNQIRHKKLYKWKICNAIWHMLSRWRKRLLFCFCFTTIKWKYISLNPEIFLLISVFHNWNCVKKSESILFLAYFFGLPWAPEIKSKNRCYVFFATSM